MPKIKSVLRGRYGSGGTKNQYPGPVHNSPFVLDLELVVVAVVLAFPRIVFLIEAMAAKIFFTTALIAVHSFTPALAVADPLITPAPLAKRSHHDLAKRQSATYETTSPLPLTEYQYPFSAIPEQVNPYAVGRGPQSGFNRCNSTTEGPNSQCQTMEVNSLVYCYHCVT